MLGEEKTVVWDAVAGGVGVEEFDGDAAVGVRAGGGFGCRCGV